MECFYCNYGYVTIQHSDKDTAKIQSVHNSFSGDVNKKSLQKEITIRVKTLYELRKIHAIQINVNDIIKKIFEKVQAIDKDKIDKKKPYRLISSSSGSIKELDFYKKIYEENLKDNEILILAPEVSNSFSEENHGDQITLDSPFIINKSYGDDIQIALTKKGCSHGKMYTEFFLDSEPDERNIIIGVSTKRTDFNLGTVTDFWGYILSEGKKISNSNQNNYGIVCKMEDVIGVLISFDETKKGKITFYVNGECMGDAFEGMEKLTYYPSVILNFEGTRVKLIENPTLPD